MKTSGKIFFGIIIFIIAAALVGSLYYGDQKEVEVFGEFSAEVPSGSYFFNVTPNDETIKEMYRCDGEDLTITSFNQQYIEDEYHNQTGKTIDYDESLLENITQGENVTVDKISDHMTRIIQTTTINGQQDTDVACVYSDNVHLIIVEGGDVNFITEIANSIRILN